MGEISKEQAESIKVGFVEIYENIKTKVEKNFNDMDFENAVQRADMEERIISMKSVCDDYIGILQGMKFL